VSERILQAWLLRSWWLLFPSFTVLSVRLTTERVCGNPYDLLPALTANSRWAWPLALLYVLPHLWLLAACLLTAARAQALAPGARVFSEVWGREAWKLLLMAAVLVLEYAPISLWRLLGSALQCAP
jgi:hypothetical protein